MSAKDRYITLEKGKLRLHEENDHYSFLSRGPEATSREVTLEELVGTDLHKQAVQLLKAHNGKKKS